MQTWLDRHRGLVFGLFSGLAILGAGVFLLAVSVASPYRDNYPKSKPCCNRNVDCPTGPLANARSGAGVCNRCGGQL